MEFYADVDMDVFFESYQTNRGKLKHKALPPCLENFLSFKESCGDLTEGERSLMGTVAEEFQKTG